ncbi:MAG: nuclear transport factor 2 family protein [Gammaproteobacteria bacterium]|nr:MAG: nuclear transport factor 2 family protein [Gammaproteobacteria bacterium]
MDLETRIARLEAIEAIRQLKHRYFRACDTKQVDIMRECFVDGDAHIDYGAVGTFQHRDALVALFEKVGCHPHMVEMHHGQNPEISITSADTAEGIWGLFYYLINTEENTLTQLGGFYHDEYRCEQGAWKISRTVFRVHSMQVHRLLDGQVLSVMAGNPAV